ncbi:YncE family protein [Streptomyces sp. NPDC102274]|uniref:YncE family protein n=1 Tax=Streptomyces sp. NPDC102274 TaxID=3366151 RepID=UPI00380A8CE1
MIDTGSHRVSATVALGPPGTDPFNLEVTSRAVYVTNRERGTLTVIVPTSNKVVATVTLGDSPYGVAVS